MATKIYVVLWILVLLGLPVYLGNLLRKGIANTTKRVAAWIVTVVCLLLFFPFAMMSVFVWAIPEYPVETKKIDNQYYFTQQEYGMAFTSPGYHVDFYKKRKYFWDKHIGYIDCQWWSGNISARIIPAANGHDAELVLMEKGEVLIDTTLNLDRSFDFKYYDYKKQ